MKISKSLIFPSLQSLILIIFFVPGSISLSKLAGLTEMKQKVGIDLNGIRLILFCILSGILVIWRGKIYKQFKFYYLFLLYCLLTLFFTLDLIEGIRFFAKLLVPFLIYALAKSITSSEFETLNKALIVITLIHFFFSLPVLIAWFKPSMEGSDIIRASGLAGARVMLGTFMLFIWILLYYRNKISEKRKSYWPMLISLLCILLSGARIAWVGLIFSLIWLGEFKKTKNILLAIAFTIGIIILFGPLIQKRVGVYMTEDKKLMIGEKGGGGTFQHRLKIWKWLFENKIPNHILFGYGLGSSKKILSELPEAGIPALDYPHNEYIRLILEGGIVGVFFFLCSYFYMGFYFKSKYKSKFFLLPIIIYLLFCLMDNTLNNYFENSAIFAYILSYLENRFSHNETKI